MRMSNTQNPHAAQILQYAQDWTETDAPWERWECRYAAGDKEWRYFVGHPIWDTKYEYRRKPKTIRIGDMEVPEPVRDVGVMEEGQVYFCPFVADKALSGFGIWS